MKNLLHIIRWPNLLMLAGIQSIVYANLVGPAHSYLTLPLFILLSGITILLGAGGYVINDYYDVETDKINKPVKRIAEKHWPLAKVKTVYFILVSLGAALSIILSIAIRLPQYLFIYPVAVTCLWYYSYCLKCKPITGNLWVAFFCAGVVAIVAMPDIFLHHTEYIKNELWYYIVFAFLSTWYREVIKDIEDEEGDRLVSCGTFVVRFGMKSGKIMALLLGLLLLISIIVWGEGQTSNWIKIGLYASASLTFASMALLWRAKSNTHYHNASNVIKLVMVLGTVLLL